MRISEHVFLVTMALFLAVSSAMAKAETWVRVVDNPGGNTTYVDVDTDSIRKDPDGLVYYTESSDWGTETNAFDCQKRLKYSVDYWKRLGKDWKAHPLEISGITVDIANFVCGRVG